MIQHQKGIAKPSTQASRNDTELAERLIEAARLLEDSVEIDSAVRGGVPVIRGTRIGIGRIFAEIADDKPLSEIADSLDLDVDVLKKVIEGISIHLDRPLDE